MKFNFIPQKCLGTFTFSNTINTIPEGATSIITFYLSYNFCSQEDVQKASAPEIHGLMSDNVNKSIEVKECGESLTSMSLAANSRLFLTGATCRKSPRKKKIRYEERLPVCIYRYWTREKTRIYNLLFFYTSSGNAGNSRDQSMKLQMNGCY